MSPRYIKLKWRQIFVSLYVNSAILLFVNGFQSYSDSHKYDIKLSIRLRENFRPIGRGKSINQSKEIGLLLLIFPFAQTKYILAANFLHYSYGEAFSPHLWHEEIFNKGVNLEITRHSPLSYFRAIVKTSFRRRLRKS